MLKVFDKTKEPQTRMQTKMTQTHGVSVVIPTLGASWLKPTIDKINSGSTIPFEILVCIPKDLVANVAAIDNSNVVIVPTHEKGQVQQRAVGFRRAKCPFILQLDDDVWLERDTLSNLVNYSLENPGTAVGPSFYDRATGRYHSYLIPKSSKHSTLERLLFKVINGSIGYKPGGISVSGVNMGVPEHGDWLGLSWLPGGCMLHRKEHLELSNYYPFPGKAYAEDLIHCFYLRSAGVNLARCGKANCSINLTAPETRIGLSLFVQEQSAYLRSMRYFVRLQRTSESRLILFLILNIFRLAFRSLRHKSLKRGNTRI